MLLWQSMSSLFTRCTDTRKFVWNFELHNPTFQHNLFTARRYPDMQSLPANEFISLLLWLLFRLDLTPIEDLCYLLGRRKRKRNQTSTSLENMIVDYRNITVCIINGWVNQKWSLCWLETEISPDSYDFDFESDTPTSFKPPYCIGMTFSWG